ncbi:MAG: hypothetical protein ABEK16_02905 [Candidatus Nanohalobium sp.]
MEKEEIRQRIEKKHVAGAVTVLIVLGVLAAVPALNNYTIKEIDRTFQTSADILPKGASENLTVGIAAGEGLSFGIIPVSANKTKFLNITAPEKIMLRVDASGNISEYLSYDPKHYFNGSKRIPIELNPEKPGNFTGVVEVNIQRPKGKVGEKWLKLKSLY